MFIDCLEADLEKLMGGLIFQGTYCGFWHESLPEVLEWDGSGVDMLPC